MKKILMATALAMVAGATFGQTANSGAGATSNSGAVGTATAVGGGMSSSSMSSTIGGSAASARGGAGGNSTAAGGTSAVTVNFTSGSGASDPSSGTGAGQTAAAQIPGDPTTHIKESIQTVGNPGAVSYGVSFSQYNCANTASVGAGFLGGVFQFGGGVESNPCNARANASALFTLAQGMASSNAEMSARLYRAAVLLIGHSTKATEDALAEAGVSDFLPSTPPAPAPQPADVGAVPGVKAYAVAQTPGKEAQLVDVVKK